MSRPFYCPTQVISTQSYAEELRDIVADQRWLLVTSSGWVRRGAVDQLVTSLGKPTAIIDAVPTNPRISNIETLRAALLRDLDIVVALGGGSVIDAAKGFAAVHALNGEMEILAAHLRDGASLPATFAPPPLVAVPTTSGTGSEVTRWATIWGDDDFKFSLQHPALYPSVAVLDPSLCTSMPEDITLATALDAVSHAMEAVWNRNHMPVSDRMASTAISEIYASLRQTIEQPTNVALRERIQVASLIAGYAMGTTQTAVAHSISYPFTAKYDMPHGFACSFTLAEVVRYNAEADGQRLLPIAEALDCSVESIGETIEKWFDELGVGKYVAQYVTPDVTDEMGDGLITRARAANNLRDIDGAEARAIARRSLDHFSRGD